VRHRVVRQCLFPVPECALGTTTGLIRYTQVLTRHAWAGTRHAPYHITPPAEGVRVQRLGLPGEEGAIARGAVRGAAGTADDDRFAGCTVEARPRPLEMHRARLRSVSNATLTHVLGAITVMPWLAAAVASRSS
jgi:hypothetical protein